MPPAGPPVVRTVTPRAVTTPLLNAETPHDAAPLVVTVLSSSLTVPLLSASTPWALKPEVVKSLLLIVRFAPTAARAP